MLGALTSLTGGGGISAGGGGPSSAKAGDASSSLNLDFTSNNAFSVGGSGKQDVSASASTSDGLTGGSNVLNYVAIGVGILALGAVVFVIARKK